MVRKARKLNRNRPFGKIVGHLANFPGARFEQDGFYFRPDGSEVLPGDGSARAEVQELTKEQEEEVDEIRVWTTETKGRQGRVDLEEYAVNDLGLDADEVSGMRVGDLRDKIVETFEAQLLAGG